MLQSTDRDILERVLSIDTCGSGTHTEVTACNIDD